MSALLSALLGSSGGSGIVGATMLMPALSPSVTLSDGSIWLRSGSLVSIASAAPALANLRQYQLPGQQTGALPTYLAGYGPTQVASNGAGVLLAVGGWTEAVPSAGSKMGLWRSTDNGVTWTNISAALPIGIAVSAVAFGGGRFVVVGLPTSGTTTRVALSFSTDAGVTWTAGADDANDANSKNWRIARLTYANGRFIGVVALSGTASYAAFASVDGSTMAVVTSNYIGAASAPSDEIDLVPSGTSAVLTRIYGPNSDGARGYCTSTDGQNWTWTARPSGSNAFFTGVVGGTTIYAESTASLGAIQSKPLLSGAWSGYTKEVFPVVGNANAIQRLLSTAADASGRLMVLDGYRTLHVFNTAMSAVEFSRQAPAGSPVSRSAQGDRILWIDANNPANPGWIMNPQALDTGDFYGISRGVGVSPMTLYVRIK